MFLKEQIFSKIQQTVMTLLPIQILNKEDKIC